MNNSLDEILLGKCQQFAIGNFFMFHLKIILEMIIQFREAESNYQNFKPSIILTMLKLSICKILSFNDYAQMNCKNILLNLKHKYIILIFDLFIIRAIGNINKSILSSQIELNFNKRLDQFVKDLFFN